MRFPTTLVVLPPLMFHAGDWAADSRSASAGRAGLEMIESRSTLSRRRDVVGTVYAAAASRLASEASLLIAVSVSLKSRFRCDDRICSSRPRFRAAVPRESDRGP